MDLTIICLELIDSIKNTILDINNTGSLYIWLCNSSDSDFFYIYEHTFKKYLNDYFSTDTLLIISYYSQNLSNAILALYELNTNIETLFLFLTKMINNQLNTLTPEQLFLK